MPEKLIVHIGANKTGSSAIQRFLSMNSLVLREEGVVVPDNEFHLSDKVQGYHVFGFQKLLQDPLEGRRHLEEAIDTVAAACPEAHTILLSAENLTANPAAPSLFENLIREYDTRIVMYIRRQDEYILSSWQQWNSKISKDFWAWAISEIGNRGNWHAYLKNWENVVAKYRIEVRIFERPRLEGGDVVEDFYSMLGLSRPMNTLRHSQNTVNPGFSDSITDLVKGNELIFKSPHDNEFYNFVMTMTGDKYLKNSRESSISFLQRQAIIAKYRKQNDRVRDKYFPHLTGELFSPPKASDYDYLSDDERNQQKFEFLTAILYKLYKKGAN